MNRETRRDPWLTTPRAILLGAFVIGVFAYAGLRDRSAPSTLTATPITPMGSASSSGSSTTPTSAEAVAVAPTLVPGEPAPSASAAPVAERSAVEAAARKALAAQMPGLKQACWKDRPADASVRILMNVTFDRTGAQLARGLSEPRLPEHQRAWLLGLGQCISEKLPALSIDPPGASVQVEIPIDLP